MFKVRSRMRDALLVERCVAGVPVCGDFMRQEK